MASSANTGRLSAVSSSVTDFRIEVWCDNRWKFTLINSIDIFNQYLVGILEENESANSSVHEILENPGDRDVLRIGSDVDYYYRHDD